VRRLGKGPVRPIVPASERIELLEALESVDLAIPFADDTPARLVEAVRPDVLAKGGDWAIEAIAGREFVEAHGGVVVNVPLREGFSTTNLEQRIRAGKSALDP